MKPFVKPPAPTRHTQDGSGKLAEYCARSIQHALEEGRINADDVTLIQQFIAENKAQTGIGQGRVNKISGTLVRWRSFLGPFRKNTLPDLYMGIDRLKAPRFPNGEPYTQNTLRDFLMILKRFYLWLRENGYVDLPEQKPRYLHSIPPIR